MAAENLKHGGENVWGHINEVFLANNGTKMRQMVNNLPRIVKTRQE